MEELQLNYSKNSEPANIRQSELTGYIDGKLNQFIKEFEQNKSPIQVNFRDLVAWVPYSESHTHFIHQYPAKLIKHIPIFFLNSSILNNKKGGTVLDPFCGSGTVLLEGILNGYNAIGCDANPLARLISQVKTTLINPKSLEKYTESITKRAKRFRRIDKKNVVNIDHWFPEATQVKLSKIHRAIIEVEDVNERNFLLVTFSNIIKKSSFADPNLSVPVKIKPEKYTNTIVRSKLEAKLEEIENCDIYSAFNSELKKNIQRIKKLYDAKIESTAKVVSKDARNITLDVPSSSSLYPSNSIDLILTSPPYAGAQKYIRSSSLNLGWLDYCEEKTLRHYEKKNIGREHYQKNDYQECVTLGIDFIDNMLEEIWAINPLRAHINGNYLLEMESALKEMYRVLKPKCYSVIVIGNNEVCGLNFESHKYLTAIAQRIGFKLELTLIDDIHSRGLMTKRNKTASVINSEWILILRK